MIGYHSNMMKVYYLLPIRKGIYEELVNMKVAMLIST